MTLLLPSPDGTRTGTVHGKAVFVTGNRAAHQRGVTLVELMVGVAIGLLIIAVAMGALMVSRGISGTVSDASNIQQQAAYAMRVIGLQLRQGSSLFLNPNPTGSSAVNAADAPVGFEVKNGDFDLGVAANLLGGKDVPSATEYALTVGYRNYEEPLFKPPTGTGIATQSLARDCLGNQPSPTLIQSNFALRGDRLRCAGAEASFPALGGAGEQPIIDHVAELQVRYLVQSANAPATLGNPTVQYVSATAVSDWAQVQAVEVCLVLYGDEAIDLPAGQSYTSCDGTPVDITALAGARHNRMHLLFRNVFQLRSQGLIAPAL